MGKIFKALEKYDIVKSESPFKQSTFEDSDQYDSTESTAVPDKARLPESAESDKNFIDRESPEAIRPENLAARPVVQKPLFEKEKLDTRLVTLHSPQSFEAEQFRMLRTNILFPAKGKPARSIMVTSVAPNEGKSFTSVNMALSIAQNLDKHVLLIDCDMRRPCIHSMLGYDQAMGLSDHLNHNIPLSQLLLKGPIERLTILPAGKRPSNPSELLSSNRMAALLQEVKSRYSDRFIIIDSPPPQLTSEAAALAQLVDGVILVVRMDYTARTAAEELVEKIGRDRFIGTIINHVKASAFSYYGKGQYSQYEKD